MNHIDGLASGSDGINDHDYVTNIVEEVAHLLPEQGPIKDFVHHNTLHAFQDQPFHDAVASASAIFGSNCYMDRGFYSAAYRTGRIHDAGIKLSLQLNLDEGGEVKYAEQQMTRYLTGQSGGLTESPHSESAKANRSNISQLVYPMLFRLAANFLDQGIAIWPMPGRHGRFWDAVGVISKGTLIPLPPLSDKVCKDFWSKDPTTVVCELLAVETSGRPEWYSFIRKLCLNHPGWSGMVRMIEKRPELLSHPRQISLMDFIALELVLRHGWKSRIKTTEHSTQPVMTQQPNRESELAAKDRVIHEALEWSYYSGLLKLLTSRKSAEPGAPETQAFFCIDDREGSLRRHLEALSPTTHTFGAPGFFGVDFMFQAADQAIPSQHCPVILTPKHVIKEVGGRNQRNKKLLAGFHVLDIANTGVRGWVATPVFGIWAMIRLSLQVLWGKSRRPAKPNRKQKPLPVLRQSETLDAHGRLIGYSLPEMADRVGNILRNCGLTKSFSKLIVMVAHGANSTNNPHFAAYDCGACAGKHGWPNARAFATMANRADVRGVLRERGLDIPDGTYFLAAMHDTTSDDIAYYDESQIPATHQAAVAEFKLKMEQALELNARERVRKFDLAPNNEDLARAHVRHRSASLFEPRPEWNHAGNAAAIVGRRNLTRDLNLERRVFLQSYDPTIDQSGDILAGILGAVVPVCGGINLEYLFSRIDNEVYGAGSKLPHNVIGLLGVAAGVAGDLLTGLPSQMVEIHDPVRLLVIVEQSREIATYAIKKNPAIFEWVHNEWIKFVTIDPESKECSLWHKDGFLKFDPISLNFQS